MKKRQNIKRIILTTASIFFLLILGACSDNSRDLSEIKSEMDSYTLEYETKYQNKPSGNVDFKIYSFNLKDESPSSIFIKKDDDFDIFIKSFNQIIESLPEDPDKKIETLKANIDVFKEAEDLEYTHLILEKTHKLYIYSLSLKKGYCFIITFTI